jgi:hypothetical protein
MLIQCHVYIVAGLSGPVIFVMYVTGVEMMMEVMVGHLVSPLKVFSLCNGTG